MEPNYIEIIKNDKSWSKEIFGKDYDFIGYSFTIIFLDNKDIKITIYRDLNNNFHNLIHSGEQFILGCKLKKQYQNVVDFIFRIKDVNNTYSWLNNYHKRKVLVEKYFMIF